jgi:hypothetical protein
VAGIGGSANGAFGDGLNYARNPGHVNSASITLDADSDRWNADAQQAAVTPHSVLAPYAFARSANGSDGQGFLPNGAYLGNSNAMSEADFDKSLTLRMAGGGGSV